MLRFSGLLVLAMVTTAGLGRGAEVGRVEELAPDVYFYQGDLDKGYCNNGFIVLEDYVLVVDANFPSAARLLIGEIRKITDKPIRFAFDTHHHGDHAYGNQVWVDQGATAVANTGVVDEMKKYETGHYGSSPGRWEEAAKEREDLRDVKLEPPSLLFPDAMIFDDGKHRVELRHFGTAHTHGDGFAWLPTERILFTGDAVVNGPHNYVGDGNVSEWIETLDRAKALGARIVAPGHGPVGTGTLVSDQQLFFRELRRFVQTKSETGGPAEVQSAVEEMASALRGNEAIARYVGDGFSAQVGKVYTELTGRELPNGRSELEAAERHLASHGEPSEQAHNDLRH
ncbi:MAG TPA: MBL fold metallo-hydrolase [Vicinamibacteria bacterium]|nr:MBL fold metallo-hydrolase [Vicinamibacteria bacterium]